MQELPDELGILALKESDLLYDFCMGFMNNLRTQCRGQRRNHISLVGKHTHLFARLL